MNSSLKFLNFSPNSSKVQAPLAESTAIGSPLTKQFQGNQKRKSISPISNPSKQRSNIRIDPHVLTDAQSNGIVSRLVKYYDQSNEPERGRNVYNKFGDFPIVQLKKTELKRPISKSTSVRIAPPCKTLMNPNLRAAIMRSNSFQLTSGLPKITPTKMRAKDDSHKIITNHEPITDTNYPVSSKSVLDALEKNCRKRINNEELILDRNKKVCAPVIPEVVDSPSAKEFIPISSAQQSAKRNREDLSPDKSSVPRTVLDNTNNQLSKRIKTKNNALLSSLSSSHYELLPALNSTIQNNSRISSVPSVTPKIVTKQKEITEVRNEEKEKLVKRIESKIDEIQQKDIEQPLRKLQLFNAKPDPNAIINRAKLKAFEDNPDDDEDEVKIRFVKPKEKVLENYDVINYVEKDKLNKMLKGLSQGIKSPVKEASNENKKGKDTIDSKTSSVPVEKQPVASISFTTSTTSSTIAPISTPSSTSSAMISINPPSILSNLVGEKKEAEVSVSNTLTSTSITSTTLPATTSSSLVTDSLPKPNLGGFQFGFSATTTQSEVPKSAPSIIPAITSSSLITTPSLMGFSKPVSPLAIFSNPKTDVPTLNVDPNKSLMSFTPVKPSETAITTQSTLLPTPVSTVTTSVPSLPIFGSTNTGGFKFGESAMPKNDPKPTVGFSFGNSEKTEPKISTGFSFGASNTSAQSAVSSTPSFSFGSNAPKIQTAPVTASISFPSNVTSPVSTANNNNNNNSMFAFGNSSAPGTQSAFPGTQSTVPSFGQPSAIGVISPLSSNASTFGKQPETTTASGVGFSFGGSSNKPANSGISFSGLATTTSSGFAFGSQLPTTTQSTGMFSTAPKTEASQGMFSFGQKPQTAPVVTTNSGFSFGSPMNSTSTALSAQPSQTSGFSFGQSTVPNNENKSTGIFSRLGDKQPENKPFSFGGSNTNNLQQSISSFGTGNTPVTTSTPTIFGAQSPNTNNTGSVFGQTAVLGSNTSNNSGNLFSSNNQASNSPFGSASSQQQQQQAGGNLFAFGQSAANSNNNNSSNQQPSTFNFGGSNTSNNNNQAMSSNNIFGSALGGSSNNNNSGQNVSASFNFNTATGNVTSSQQQSQQASSPFGQQSSAPPPYQFGQSAVGNNVSASFSFSGASSAPLTVQTPPSGASMFNFQNSGQPAVPGAFNFQGQTAAPQPSPGGNLFNIGTGGNQQRRPTRVATRRYK